MKKILAAGFATIGGLVLLMSYRTSLGAFADPGIDTAAAGTGTTTSETSAGGGSSAGSDDEASESSADDETAEAGASASTGTSSGSSGGSSGSSTASTTAADGVYTGTAANTRYGAVQVQITVSGGAIVDVQVPAYPNSNPKDAQINQRAIPQLVSETLSAQSANIQYVSGATFTSDGYVASLQSALDQAGL